MSEEASPRPQHSGGRALMDHNPDFQMDAMASIRTEGQLKTPSGPTFDEVSLQNMVPVSSIHKSTARRGQHSRLLPSSDSKKISKTSKTLEMATTSDPVAQLSKTPRVEESPATSSPGERGRSEQTRRKKTVESQPR